MAKAQSQPRTRAGGAATIRVGNGAGFWGDNLDAPVRLAEAGHLDFLTLEYLAELTLSILAHMRRKDPAAGYVPDFPAVLKRLAPLLAAQPGLRIVTNAGGLNPLACARECARVLSEAGMPDCKVAWVGGDDLLPRIPELGAAGERFRHFDTGAEPGELLPSLVCANAYLGAEPIARALDAGARVVVTGRVADASLALGPALHAFGWAPDDWDRLAAARVAGHLIECGAQVTGGLLTRWNAVPGWADIGYPVAEISADGSVRITKPEGTGGRVDIETVSEQLVYEIGDPASYHTPDVTADLTGVTLEQEGKDRVAVRGARGKPPPATLKVSCAYADGYSARGDLVVCGADAVEKARAAADILLGRLRSAGREPAAHHVEVIGAGDVLPGKPSQPPAAPREVMLRVAVRDPERAVVERFCREFSPLVTAGPPGITGYAGSRPQARPVLNYWPTTVDCRRVQASVGVTVAAHLSEDVADDFFADLEVRR